MRTLSMDNVTTTTPGHASPRGLQPGGSLGWPGRSMLGSLQQEMLKGGVHHDLGLGPKGRAARRGAGEQEEPAPQSLALTLPKRTAVHTPKATRSRGLLSRGQG